MNESAYHKHIEDSMRAKNLYAALKELYFDIPDNSKMTLTALKDKIITIEDKRLLEAYGWA